MKRKQVSKLFDQLLEQMHTGEVIKVFVEAKEPEYRPVEGKTALWVATNQPYAMRFMWIDLYLYMYDGEKGVWHIVDWDAFRNDMKHYRLLSVVI